MLKRQGSPKQWRVRGKSTDGMTVTLGSHETEDEAHADAKKLLQEGFYRDVTVERIPRAAEPEPDGA